MALIRVNKAGSALGSLEAGGVIVGKCYYNDFDGSGPSGLDNVPTTAYTPAGSGAGCVIGNLGEAYSTLDIVNPSAITGYIFKSDGTTIALGDSAQVNISEGVCYLIEWGRSSTRPTLTFTAKA